MMMKTRRRAGSLLSVAVLAGVLAAVPQGAFANEPNCGTSGSSTVCVTLPASTLTGATTIGVTVTFPSGRAPVIVTWVPSGRPDIYLMTKSKPSPEFGDYSFVWPTQKYLDGSGVLRVQVGSTAATPVDTLVTLSNGNTTDFQHSLSNWGSYLPGAWSSLADPVVAAVGDAAADEVNPNTLAATIKATSPALFLYLGDIAEQGSFTENLNNYGASALDAPAGTLFGAMASSTQPTLGNHEAGHVVDWTDYWHGRPEYTSFTFGGVKFLDLDSNASMKRGSPQYLFVQDQLASSPACVVTYWHRPTINKSKIAANFKRMWALLAANGGDLVLNGHVHNMTQYVPLDASLLATAGAHMRQLISGAGGHTLANASIDPGGHIQWSLGKTTGFLALTLVGARNRGMATAINWEFRDINGTRIGAPGSFGSITC